MRSRITAIVLKDLRHLRIALAAFYVWLVLLVPLQAVQAAAASGNFLLLHVVVWNVITVLALWTVIALLIQADRLQGDRQYWLTRPYSWWELLVAKLLFLTLFVQLPVLLVQSLVLEEFYISPLDFLPAMLTKQVLFAAFLILPAFALAARTASLRLFYGELVVVGLAPLLAALLANRGQTFMVTFGYEPDWIRIVAIGACLTVFSGAMIVHQYRRGGAWPSFGLLVAGTIATLAAAFILPYATTAAIDAMFRPATIDARHVQIAFVADPPRVPSNAFLRLERERRTPEAGHISQSTVVLPFVASHLPPGAWFHLTSVAVFESRTPANTHWIAAEPISGAMQQVSSNGIVNFSLGLDNDVFPRTRNESVFLDAEIRVSVSWDTHRPATPLPDDFLKIPGIGTCARLDTDRWGCFSPYRGPALFARAIVSSPKLTGPLWTEVFPLRESRVPISPTVGFSPLEFATVAAPSQDPGFRAHWSAATFERIVRLGRVELNAYRRDLPLVGVGAR